MTQNPFENLTEAQKESLDFAKKLAVGHVIYGVVRLVAVHAIGRKIAPKLFKNIGRTYSLITLVSLLTARPKLSEEGREKLLTVQRILKEAQAQKNNFGDHDDVIKG